MSVRRGGLLGVALALAAGLGATPAGASARPGAGLSVSASATAATRLGVRACWSAAPRGAVGEVQSVGVGGVDWSVRARRALGHPAGCTTMAVVTGSLGAYDLRFAVLARGHLAALSPLRVLHVYGTINAAALLYAEFGCGGSTMTVSDGVHSFSADCRLSAGRGASQPSVAQFRHPTTCRSMTLSLLGTDNPPGDLGDQSVDTLSVLQSNLPVASSTFDANRVTTVTIALDGSAATIDTSNNQGDFSESIYVLATGSTAQCWTPMGVPGA